MDCELEGKSQLFNHYVVDMYCFYNSVTVASMNFLLNVEGLSMGVVSHLFTVCARGS